MARWRGAAPLAVWDVDGTLVDSRSLIDACMREALVAAGQPSPTYDAVRQIVGLGLTEACGVLAPELKGADLDRLVDLYKQAFNDRRRAPGFNEPLYEGAAETLARLQAEGWKLAMATGKSRRGVEHIIAMHDWHDVFHTTHCDEDGPGKPDPAMLVATMAAMDVEARRTIMIGDTSHDMKMARAAGAYAQGVSWGFHTEAEVRAAGAVEVANDFAALNAALDRFAGAL